MITLYAIITGFVLDMLLGDPLWIPHPVVLMGKAITFLEKRLRDLLPDTKEGQRTGGRILAVVLPIGGLIISWALLALSAWIHPALRYAVESWMCYQIFATRELNRQSMEVYIKLHDGDLPAARTAVGRIVGRDTAQLSYTEVIRAAVETVAENLSDGVIAPMIFMAIGGAPLGFFYKAVNTMDSMVGYKNDRYLHFGRASAKLDDILNFLPARFSGLCIIAVAPLAGCDGTSALRIWRRDGHNHASPNSAQTEAACAGALNIQLAGPAVYFGELVKKPTIGDAGRPAEIRDIPRTNRLMLISAVLALLICCAVRFIICQMM